MKISPALDEKTVCEYVGDVDAILGFRITRRIIESAPKLRFIQALGTGVDDIDLDAAFERGVMVCNSVGENAVEVSEHAMALMLALAKNLHKYQRNLASGNVQRLRQLMLKGKTLGIIGLGSVGMEVAKRVRPLGMRVIAIRRHPQDDLKEKFGLEFLGGPGDFDYILRESDFLLLSAVLTKETKGMIGERQLSLMKDGAYLINIARGGLVDETALSAALRRGKLAGAALDVFQLEPITPDNPLIGLENVILTPHVAGGAWPPQATPKRVEFIVSNIIKALTGGKPDNVVDPDLGYAHTSFSRVLDSSN